MTSVVTKGLVVVQTCEIKKPLNVRKTTCSSYTSLKIAILCKCVFKIVSTFHKPLTKFGSKKAA